MNKKLSVLLAVTGCAGSVFSIMMLISAVQFLEWGRVFFCLLIAIIFAQFGVWGIVSAVKKKN